ncbi:hypothetical protein LPC08_20080 [Roseomonas sp. OT10]|uniref:FliH/SctL family protein n=1 Tax=Roseomonas cutis TaxID=2897332 RepID=UPI001E5CC455|nr:hypothetical protein [Roseomonas sp. OT10]UFN48287.1 hypothetical protein LPC08_20080 [Roseomonas sp. OT10]
MSSFRSHRLAIGGANLPRALPMLRALALPDLDAPPPPPPAEGPGPEEIAAMLDAARDAARADGYAAGEQAGWEAALASQAARLDGALAALLPQLEAMLREERAASEARTRELAVLLLRLVDAALPGAAARAAPDLLDRLMEHLGPVLEVPEGATVLVPPEVLEAARRRLDGTGLAVAADPALAPGDARIAWRGGGLAMDLAARRAAIGEVLASLGLTEEDPR